MDSKTDPSHEDFPPQKIAIFLPSLSAGGVARVMLQLAKAFVTAGHQVDMVLCQQKGEFTVNLPSGIRVLGLQPCSTWKARLTLFSRKRSSIRPLLLPIFLSLKPPKALRFLPALIRYLKNDNPAVLLSAKTHINLVALWATQFCGPSRQVVISERTTLSDIVNKSKKWRWRFILPVLTKEYPAAKGIITVSNGVKQELINHTGLSEEKITTIYNPLLIDVIRAKSAAPIDHPWFQETGTPIILGVGRLVPQKDFPTLLRAFSLVRQVRPARLVIVGEGRARPDLEALANQLRIASDLWMPGFSDNPYAFMSKASMLVLSSTYEGLPNVLIEALACGCPVVSTDCPSGPSEILQKGKFGLLVPMGDIQALAQAIQDTLDHPPKRQELFSRAADFDIEKISRKYLEVLLRN